MKMTKAVCATIVVLGSMALSAEAADLFLRPAGSQNDSSMIVGEGGGAAIEIVVQLAEGEELGFANIFLEIDDGNLLEALDFVPGLDVPPSVYTSHEQVMRARFGEFPYSPGEGIAINEYALILTTGGLVGPGTFVLERIEVFGANVGAERIAFEFGARPPGLFDSDSGQYPVATYEFPRGLSRIVYVGIGDGRDGEAGPLAATVEEASPDDDPPPPINDPPPPNGGGENDNDSENGNDNGSDNTNDNGPDDPPDQEPEGNDNDNIAPQDNDNTSDDAPANDNDAGDPLVDDGGVPIDPADTDNANVSDDGSGNDNSGDADPGNDNGSTQDPLDDEPEEQDVPNDNDNADDPTPPKATRPCAFGIVPAMVSIMAALGLARRRSNWLIG